MFNDTFILDYYSTDSPCPSWFVRISRECTGPSTVELFVELGPDGNGDCLLHVELVHEGVLPASSCVWEKTLKKPADCHDFGSIPLDPECGCDSDSYGPACHFDGSNCYVRGLDELPS